MENAPKTFAELMKGERWRKVRSLFKRHNATLSVSTSEEAMGRYAEVVLDGDGFKIKSGRAAMVAAFAGKSDSFTSLRRADEVLERALVYDDSLSEAGMLAEIVKKIDELQSVPSKRRTAKV